MVQHFDVAEEFVVDDLAARELGRQGLAVRQHGELLPVEVVAGRDLPFQRHAAVHDDGMRLEGFVRRQELALPRAAAAAEEGQQRAAAVRGAGGCDRCAGADGHAGGRQARSGVAQLGAPGLRRQADADVRTALGLDFDRQGRSGRRPLHRDPDLEGPAMNVPLAEELVLVQDAGRQDRSAEFDGRVQAAEAEAVLVHVIAVGYLPAQYDFPPASLARVTEGLLGAQQSRLGGGGLGRQRREQEQQYSDHGVASLRDGRGRTRWRAPSRDNRRVRPTQGQPRPREVRRDAVPARAP